MPTHFNQILDPNQPPEQVPGATPGAPPGFPQAGPPVDQQDREQRVSGWTKFLNAMKTDPALQQFMIQTGTTLLQGQRPGERFNGLVGRALQGGNLAGQFINQNQRRAGQEERRIGVEEERVGIQGDIAESTIATGVESRRTSKQTREQGATAFPSIQEKRAAETAGVKAETTVKEAAATNIAEKTLADINLTKAKTKAEISLANFRDKAKPSETATQTAYRAFEDANPGMKLQDVATKFLAYLGIKERAAMVRAAGVIAADPTVDRAVRDGFIDWLIQERERTTKRAPEPKRKLKPNEAEGKIRGAGGSIPTPTTTAEYNALPSGTRYLNPDGTERTKP